MLAACWCAYQCYYSTRSRLAPLNDISSPRLLQLNVSVVRLQAHLVALALNRLALMANDRRWIAIASLGLVAVFVVGMSLFPTGLVGGVDSGAALHGRKLCGNHNDELAQFVKEVKVRCC